MTYTPYTSTTGSTSSSTATYSTVSGDGISYVPNYLYYLGMNDSDRPLNGYVFLTREEARAARRDLAMEYPMATFRMYRVSVNQDSSRTS